MTYDIYQTYQYNYDRGPVFASDAKPDRLKAELQTARLHLCSKKWSKNLRRGNNPLLRCD